jgi:hypothetical protein
MRQFSIGLFILATLGSILLIGQAFDFKSFGGDGFAAYPTLNLNSAEWQRGSMYLFENEGSITPYPNLEIAGEKGTSIVFLDTRANHFTLRLETGRVNTKGNLNIQVNKLLMNATGDTEIIHYSWKNEVEITVREGIANVSGPEGKITYSSPTNIRLSTQTGMNLE